MLRKILILTFVSLFAVSCSNKSSRDDALNTASSEAGSGTVYFDFDSYELSSSAQNVLDKKIVKQLKNSPSAKVKINGHCDERGTAEYNIVLGKKRANAVRDYLVDNGISSNRIKTYSYGESKPADKGHNEEAWAKNRRAVSISISK